MTLSKSEKIALEEYLYAAEALYRHLAGERQNPPVLCYLVRQMADARGPMLAALHEHQGRPLPEVG